MYHALLRFQLVALLAAQRARLGDREKDVLGPRVAVAHGGVVQPAVLEHLLGAHDAVLRHPQHRGRRALAGAAVGEHDISGVPPDRLRARGGADDRRV